MSFIPFSTPSLKSLGSWLSRSFSHGEDRLFLWLTMGLFVALWCVHIWISDDALLTFREILNFTEGHGIVWNWGERVQIFTHPAWFFLLSATHVISGGLFEPNLLKYSSLFVSFVLCMSALWLFLREMKGLQKGVVVVVLLCLLSSQAFIDYTSSGLENSLSYFLVVLIVGRFFADRNDRFFFLLCAMLFLNRMDYALLLLPLCLYFWRSCGYKISIIFPAVSLCLLWFVFSTWYFGHPLPNTFLAKTNIDAPFWNFILQGLLYYIRTLTQDPVTLFVIFVAASFFNATVRPRRWSRMGAVGSGVVFYGLYLLWIGGDFMQGRFFSVLFFFALCGLAFFIRDSKIRFDFARVRSWQKRKRVVLLCFLLLSAISLAQRFHEGFVRPEKRFGVVFGIANERRFYLRRNISSNFQSFQASAPSSVRLWCCPGAIAIASNGGEYILDTIALSSPYLSRIPGRWGRIGHMGHAIPTDMEAWVLGASDSLEDPHTNLFFSDVRHVVRGDLFSWDRMKKIAKINLHDYNIDYSSTKTKNQPRFSRFYPSLQQKVSFADLPFVDQNTWNTDEGKRWSAYNITQSVSIEIEKTNIKKVSFPVLGIREYTWSLYDGQKKVYEDSYKTDKGYSFHTFTLPSAMQANRLVFVVDKGGRHRHMARPILEPILKLELE